MSGNTIGPASRRLKVDFELEVKDSGHYHNMDPSTGTEEFNWAEFAKESTLANLSHVQDVASRMNNLLDSKQPDSFNSDDEYDGHIVVRYGVTVWFCSELPYGPESYAYLNNFHKRDDDVDADDPRIQAHQNAYPDATEI